MKNPFEKEKNTNVWLAVVLGALTAGAVAYFLIDKRNKAAAKLANAAEDAQEKAAKYLKMKAGKPKKHKSDIHELEQLAHSHHVS